LLCAAIGLAPHPGHAAPAAAGAEPLAALPSFDPQIRATLAPLAGKQVVGFKVLHVSADVGPWQDSGMALQAGDRVTLVLDGRQWLSRAHGLYFDAPVATWAKVGDAGWIFRGERATNTVTVSESGTLRFKTYPSLKWVDERGGYVGDPAPANPDAGGGINVAVIRWAPGTDVQAQLQRLAAPWAAAELARLRSPPQPLPSGWSPLWEIGSSQMFSEQMAPDGAGAPPRAIAMHMRNDVSILRKDASIELQPGTVLRWKWKAERLPGVAAENSAATHDYMSIAVEFDNGQDLSFLWSRDLPVGQVFRCPLPGWTDRETHVVARSGTAELGRWIEEERDIHELYARAVGGPLPGRIVRVWLIGVSLFQHGEGSSQFGSITLANGRRVLDVY
jgi:hypothetical protein